MNHALVRGLTRQSRAGALWVPARAISYESLILAQNERWQRGLGMQVERDRPGSNIGP